MNLKAQSEHKHAQLAAERFDEWAGTYGDDRIKDWFRYYQTYALNSFNVLESSNFLDVGCGTGWATIEIAKKIISGKVCGIDISRRMIENARTAARKVSNTEFRVANADCIPYPDDSFDLVLNTFSFHHYPNPLKALFEMRRVMKKEGELIIIDSARDVSFPIFLQDCWRRFFEKSHLKYYRTDEMKALIDEAQLTLTGRISSVKKIFFKGKVFTGLMFLKCIKL